MPEKLNTYEKQAQTGVYYQPRVIIGGVVPSFYVYVFLTSEINEYTNFKRYLSL